MSEENNEYRNKSVINQRGATIEINNSTDREEVKISQYSGSHQTINNVVNSELATNNKQTKVNFDSFESIGHDKTTYVGHNNVQRTVETTYDLKGFDFPEEIEQAEKWRETYRPVAQANSKFFMARGGKSFPDSVATALDGERLDNPTINQVITRLNNQLGVYTPTPVRTSKKDEVATYEPLTPRGHPPASPASPDPDADISRGNVNCPDGTGKSAATEAGSWATIPEKQPDKLREQILETQRTLCNIEDKMGNGGDEIEFVKRHKIETIGSINNDYASIRVDPVGRSHPVEVTVGDNLAFANVGAVPHVEEIDNDMNFPVGNYTLNVGNRYNIQTGSGGVQIKTTGGVEIGGTSCKIACNKINIQSQYGVSISSESYVELQSANSISLRSNKQVYIEPGLGIRNNLTVGGGIYAEGEVLVHHITAPVEIQQTLDTIVYGKFVTTEDRKLEIGEVLIDDVWHPVYAKAGDDIIVTYPHSHHFPNLPLRLVTTNKEVRKIAQNENINVNGANVAALEMLHERKIKTYNDFSPADKLAGIAMIEQFKAKPAEAHDCFS